MKMKCTIENPNLKTWSRVIQSLSVIGDQDIYFSFTDSTLTLTAFGSALEVCVACTFFRNFFQSYDVPRNTVLLFRVPSKCILKPFRSMRFLTKSCNFCTIQFETGGDTVVVTMGCKSGAEIRYTVDLAADAELLQVDQDPDALKNWIKTEPKLIIGSLSNFVHSKGLNDLTLQVKGNKLFLKNCMTEVAKKDGRVYTEFVLNAVDFVEYSIQEDSELTFGLREFKNFAGLAEHMKLPFSVHFQGAADPVVFTLKSEILESTMTLATKCIADDETHDPSQSSTTSNGRISNVSSEDIQNRNNDAEVIRNPEASGSSRDVVSEIEHVARSTPGPTPRPESGFGDVNHRGKLQAEPEAMRRSTRNKKNQRENDVSPLSPVVLTFRETSPPRKRFRDLFPNIGVPFDIYKAFPGHDIVLAEESDEEEN